MSNSTVEIEKFNGKNFDLWKLKMEDLLVDKERWVAMDMGSKPIAMSKEDWDKLDKKERTTICLCTSNLILFNVSGEHFAKKLWEKLGNLYQSKSLVN